MRAVTLLARAAADYPAASMLLTRVIPLLEEVIAGLPAELELLTAISGAIPSPQGH